MISVITQLEMHHLVRCALLVMSVHFKIRLSGVKKIIFQMVETYNIYCLVVFSLSVCPLLVSQLVTHNIVSCKVLPFSVDNTRGK